MGWLSSRMRSAHTLLSADTPWLVFVTGVLVALHRDVIVGGRYYLFGDNASANFPWHYFVWEHVRHGGLTAPCREMALGFQLYAEPQVQCFYPFNTALWPLADPFFSYMLKMVLHMLSGTVGMYVLARYLGRSALAAAGAAVVMCGGSFMIYRVVHAPLLFSLAWLPWIVLLYLQALQRGSKLAFLGLIGCAALQILTGHPQLTIYTALICMILGLGTDPLAEETRWRHWARVVGLIVGAYGCGLLLAVVQIAPTYELYLYGFRTHGADVALIRSWGASFKDLSVDLLGRAEAQWKWEKVAFPGSLAWVAVFYGLFTWKDKPSRALLAVVAVGLLFTWSDTNPLYEVLAYVPVINRFRASGRIGVLIIIGSALLLARFLDEVRESKARRLIWSIVAVLGLFELTALGTTGRLGLGPLSPRDPLGWQFPVLLAALAGVVVAVRLPHWRRILPAFLVCLVAYELLIFAQGVNPTLSRQEFEQAPEQQLYKLAAARCRETGGAFVRWKDGGMSNISVYYGVPQARAFTPMSYPAMEVVNALFYGPNTPAQLAAFGVQWVGTDEVTARRKGLTPVDRVGDWVLCKSPLPARRAYIPHDLIPGELDVASQELADRSVDPCYTAVVSPQAIGDQPIRTAGGQTQVQEDTPTRLVVKTRTTQPGLVIVTQLWTPKWSVTVDGQSTQPLTANAILLAATVPAGDHVVAFTYDPEILRPAAVSLLLTLLWIGLLVVEIRSVQARRRTAAVPTATD